MEKRDGERIFSRECVILRPSETGHEGSLEVDSSV